MPKNNNETDLQQSRILHCPEVSGVWSGRAVVSIPGFKEDVGKIRYELIDPKFLNGLAAKLSWAIKNKYPANNWQKVKHGRRRYYGALVRHLEAWRQGEQVDPETGLWHLDAATCCLMFIHFYDSAGVVEEPFPCEDRKCDYCYPQNKELP